MGARGHDVMMEKEEHPWSRWDRHTGLQDSGPGVPRVASCLQWC